MGQSIPHAYAATFCDQAQFVSDITVPDGASFAPGASFTKTWRFTNAGNCTWTTSYQLVYAGGDVMGSTTPVNLPVNVTPGQMLDISVNLTAPANAGQYKSLWKFANASGAQFGIGDSGTDAFWVDLNVVATNAVIYDFVANAPYAQWKSGAGTLPYPGTSGDRRGFSYQLDKPHLEDDSFDSLPGLLTVPQNKYNGYIQATYPEFQVQQGDKLETLVNCEFGATGCYVTFRIDYLLPNGLQKKLWQWKEAPDKRFYRASIDLSPLAGQKVRFVFMLLSTGIASNDRAIWGSPRIVRAGTIQPPAPPATLTALPPLTPTPTPITPPPPPIGPAGCDRATFLTDVNIPDGTTFAPGAAFSKTWRIKNTGSCTWTKDYKLTYYSGEVMNAQTAVNMPFYVYPGETVDVTVNMVAPGAPGDYRSYWILANTSGTMFGIGSNASNPFWVDIRVAGESPQETGYNFWLNACSAQWKSGAGYLPCPGTAGDRKGYVIADNFSHLEDGTMGPAPTLLLAPENKYNGYIQGFYPAFTVQPGDRFRSVVGCEYGTSCYVTFRLDYMNPNGYIGNFWQWREANDKKNYTVDVDLSPLAGRSVRFILTILATGSANGDLVRWGAPMIIRAGGSEPPTITPVPPTITITPSTNDWLTYINSTYGFQFMYPPQAQIFNQFPESLLMNLPIIPGTNLMEKYLETSVTQNAGTCQSPLATPMHGTSETVTINGISFLKQTDGDAGAGNFHDWVAYSTARDNTCVSMGFVLHYLNAGTSDPPQPEFDRAAESAVFAQMMTTFTWLATPSTITPVPPTLTPVPPTLTPTPATPIYAPTISSLHMIDSVNGWALSDLYVLRTYDGGATWYNVLFESLPVGGYFASSTRAWVISNYADANIGSLYRTTDGGLNWTRYDVPFNGGYIQFLDDNNGFVLYGEASGMQKQAVQLYQTTDGGATWTLKYDNNPTLPTPSTSLPFSGHKNGMTFRDTSTGWVGGDYPTNGYVYLYKTTDSGTSWSQVSLPLPAGYESAYITINAPKFFGANDGILPVWMSIGAGMKDLFLYVTHNGGATWTASPAFARNAEHTNVISMSNTISWDWANIFHATSNAGNSWMTITPNVTFGDGFRELDFVSATTGWARLQLPDGHTALYRTIDGGSTWTLLFGHNDPTPTPAPDPSTFSQSLVNTLNAKDFSSVNASLDQTFILALWQSQGTAYTPDLAVEQLQTNYLGTASLTIDLSKNLTALLGGTDPFSAVGLDPTKSFAVFVSGWGLSGSDEAILYITQRTDGSLYWHSVLIAQGGFASGNTSISHEAFCADTRTAPLIAQLKNSMNISDGNLFASMVSPSSGVDVRLWAYAAPANFTTTTAKDVFTSTAIYNWGGGPSGMPDLGTFKDIIQPKMLDVLNAPNMETYCDSLDKVYPLANPWPYPNIRYYNLYKPASDQVFDFRTWLIGFEYINNQPYLHSMVTIVWEP